MSAAKWCAEGMMPALVASDWYVTAEKVEELVRRIVARVHPLEVIAFGSRARGEHRVDSDLDLAVIVDDEQQSRQKLDGVRDDLRMPVDLMVVNKEKYDRFRPWINTVHQQIDREGVRLYDRGKQPATRAAFDSLCTRRQDTQLRAS